MRGISHIFAASKRNKMKKVIFYAFAAFAALTLISNASGYRFPATGAPGEDGTSCAQAGCHNGGTFAPELSFSLTDSNGDLVNSYTAGDEYTVSMKISSTGLPGGYGFQMVSLNAADEPVNNFINLPSTMQEITRLERQYITHTGIFFTDSISIEWVAPDAGQESVTFYAIGNAVDANGRNSGDAAGRGTFTISENLSSTNELTELELNIFPNPTQDVISIPNNIVVKEVHLYELSGKLIRTGTTNSMNISDVESGNYLIKVIDRSNTIYTEQVQKI